MPQQRKIRDRHHHPVPTSSAAEQPEQDASKSDTAATPRRSTGGLGGKVLAELQEIARGLDISGASKMRKGELIDAIKAAQGTTTTRSKTPTGDRTGDPGDDPTDDTVKESKGEQDESISTPDIDEKSTSTSDDGPKPDRKTDDNTQSDQKNDGGRNRNQGGGPQPGPQPGWRRPQPGTVTRTATATRVATTATRVATTAPGWRHRNQGGDNRDDDDLGGGGRRRNRRGRNRGNRGPEGEPTYSEDDVLVPAAGILDILDNYAFVRTTGYLPSENDVYVSLSMVRKWGLRKGDAVVGQVRQPREGERKEKFNPMVRVDSVNGMTIDEAKKRVEFSKLTPLYPSERLRLETDQAPWPGGSSTSWPRSARVSAVSSSPRPRRARR